MSLFISFEGIDGCGKTTQAELLRARLHRADIRVLATREPGGTMLGETIRGHLLDADARQTLEDGAELLLFGAARAQHVAETIRPALERGEVVLCDRFADSSLAYQGGGLRLDADFIARLNRFATDGLQPDVTFLLDIDPAAGARRRAGRVPTEQENEENGARAADRIEGRGLEFQRRVRAAFLELAWAAPQRIVTLDGAAPAAAVHERIVHALRERGCRF